MNHMNNYYLYINEFFQASKVRTDTHDSSLEIMQIAVDGFVTYVVGEHNGIKYDIWVNDEGLYRNDFYVNDLASSLYGLQQLVGPALIAKSDDEGKTIPLTNEEIENLQTGFMNFRGEQIPISDHILFMGDAYSIDVLAKATETVREVYQTKNAEMAK